MRTVFHAIGVGSGSECIGLGVVELSMLGSCSVSATIGAGLSDGPHAISVDILNSV